MCHGCGSKKQKKKKKPKKWKTNKQKTSRLLKKDKKGHYFIIKGSIQEEDIILANIYVPNIGASKYIQQILADIIEIDGSAIIVGYFNSPLISMDRFSRQKINKATKILNDTIELLDLIDIFRTLHQKNKNKNKTKQHIQSFQVHIL